MRKILIAVSVLLSFTVIVLAQSTQKKDSLHIYLNEVTVSSLRANEKSAVTYSDVSSEEIEKQNGGRDIPYLLSLTPSFVTTSDAGTGIGYTNYSIRGTDANRINVTINGVPLNDSESHIVFFVNTPDFASSLSSVQIQRGVGTSTNGAAAFGASINMQTEKLNPNAYAEISSTYGSFNTNKNMLKVGTGLMNDRWAFDIRLSNVKSDGYVDRSNADLKSYYFSGYYLGEKSSLKFITFGGAEKTHQSWNGVSADSLVSNRTYNELGSYIDDNGYERFYNNQTDNYNQTHYQLNWIQQINSDFNLQLTGHYTRGFGYYEDYKNNRKYIEYGLTPAVVNGVTLSKTDLVRQKWLDNHFGGIAWSVNYNKNKISSTLGGSLNRYDGDHFGKVIWVRNAQGLDIDKDWYRNNGLKDDANIYAKVTAEVLPNLFLNGDLQYRYIYYKMAGQDDKYDATAGEMRDLTQTHVFNFLNPKLGLTYAINENNNVYASYSVANREPNRKNYTEAGPNDRPRSERLYDTEIGYRYQNRNFAAGINLFNMKYKDQLILTGKISEIGEALTSNIPDSYRRGVEFIVGYKLQDWFKWDANLSLMQHKILNLTEYDVESYDVNWNQLPSVSTTIGTTNIAMSPSVVFNNKFAFNFKRFEVGLLSNYVGKQYLDNTSNADRMLPSYFVNNLIANYSLPLELIRSVDFSLQVNNLFNAKYITNGYVWYSYYLDGERINDLRYFPQAGTHFLATITVKI
ncbi:TonB-dependent receptor [Paludibacter sp.]